MEDREVSDHQALARALLAAIMTWVMKTWNLLAHLSRPMPKRAVSGGIGHVILVVEEIKSDISFQKVAIFRQYHQMWLIDPTHPHFLQHNEEWAPR